MVKRKSIRVVFLLSAMLTSLWAASQNRTSYFVEHSPNRHNLNASFAPAQGYIGIPLLGDVTLASSSNAGVSTFLYPGTGGPVLFLNSSVSPSTFLSSLGNYTYFDASACADILDAGWRTRRDFFWTVNIGIRSDTESYIPKELFTLLKNGCYSSSASTYEIPDVYACADVYAQASVGFSAPIKSLEGFRIGGKLKLLAPVADSRMRITGMTVTMSGSKYTLSASGEGYVAGKGIRLDTDSKSKVTAVGLEPSEMGLSGFGFGLDLGMSYRLSEGTLLDGLLFSVSITDLGVIFDSRDAVQSLSFGGNSFTYNGVTVSGLHDNSIDGQFAAIGDRLSDAFSVYRKAVNSSERPSLSSKVYGGFGYQFLDDRMTVGVLYSHRFGQFHHSDEVTLSYNYAPAKCFDVAVSWSFLNNVRSVGLLLTFVPWRGINVILGSDYNYLRYSAHGIPMYRATMNLNFGLSIPIQAGIFKTASE